MWCRKVHRVDRRDSRPEADQGEDWLGSSELEGPIWRRRKAMSQKRSKQKRRLERQRVDTINASHEAGHAVTVFATGADVQGNLVLRS